METIKNYVGSDAAVRGAVLDLEILIGDAESAETVDGNDFDASDAVRALNILIDRLNEK
jgi:hypothetical protein